MLIHELSKVQKPSRVVVLGASGFIGGEIEKRIRDAGITTLALTGDSIDLLSSAASNLLGAILQPTDVLVVASGKVPCKDLTMLHDNLSMIKSVCIALEHQPVAQVVYISSDAVYKDSINPLTEASCAEPASLHGVMHLSREIALRQKFIGLLAIVRPTLVYGLNDPHNSYGPNSFRRLAAQGIDITLFGEGEERRDHVDVQDVAELVLNIIQRRSSGIINAVSGQVVSYRELAEFVANAFLPKVNVLSSMREGKMPHNGYRAFSNQTLRAVLPELKFKCWKEGLTEVHRLLKIKGIS